VHCVVVIGALVVELLLHGTTSDALLPASWRVAQPSARSRTQTHPPPRAVGAKNANLGKATAGLPEYLQKKAHLSMHFELTRSIFHEIKARDLYQLGALEQALVFDEKKSSDLQALFASWNLKRCARA
jgi:Sec1 family